MIQPPVENVDRALIRAFVEAGAQFTPVTAALARLYQTTHPSQFEQALAAWRSEVSDASNSHETRLTALETAHHPQLKLSEEAQAVAVWLSRESPVGLADFVDDDALRRAFPAYSPRDLQDAAAELKLAGLVTTSAAIGHPLRMVTPQVELFAIFDPMVLGQSPQDDAITLARTILDHDEGHTPKLAEILGWAPRRLNPALALLLPLVPDGLVRKVIQPTWLTLGFSVSADVRAGLKQLLRTHGV